MALCMETFVNSRHSQQTDNLGLSALLEPMWLETGRVGFLTSSLFCRGLDILVYQAPGQGDSLEIKARPHCPNLTFLGIRLIYSPDRLLEGSGSLLHSFSITLLSPLTEPESNADVQMLNRCWLTQRSLSGVSESLVMGFLGIFVLPSPGWDPCVLMALLFTPAGVYLKLRSHCSYRPCAQLSEEPDGRAGVSMLFNFRPTLFFSPELEGLISACACMV